MAGFPRVEHFCADLHPDSARILDRARERIANPERWCRGRFATRGDGRIKLSATDPTVDRWSLRGAIVAESAALAQQFYRHRLMWFVDMCAQERGYRNAAMLNDRVSHAEVVAFLSEVAAFLSGNLVPDGVA